MDKSTQLLIEVINAGVARDASKFKRILDIWHNSRWIEDLQARKRIQWACKYAARCIHSRYGDYIFKAVAGTITQQDIEEIKKMP